LSAITMHDSTSRIAGTKSSVGTLIQIFFM
jgi:hypothetical protein